MNTSTVTIKGQVVIPAGIRRRLGIKNGTRIHFYEENGEIRMIPVTRDMIDNNIGFIGTKGKLLKALEEEKRSERER